MRKLSLKANGKAAEPSRRESLPFSRQAARTEATRRKLLAAAQRIFASSGFEAARIEDIAAKAGYTRGAFYANFGSKEEIFFAVFEQWVHERIETVRDALNVHSEPDRKLEALRGYYAELAQNRTLVFLSLEFKLFALRHPEAYDRLRDRHRRLRSAWSDVISEVLDALGKKLPISHRAAAISLVALANTLLIEHLVDQKTLPEKDVRFVLGLFFDSVFQADTPRDRTTERKALKRN
jgi:AcrR family transcriptional regulator